MSKFLQIAEYIVDVNDVVATVRTSKKRLTVVLRNTTQTMILEGEDATKFENFMIYNSTKL